MVERVLIVDWLSKLYVKRAKYIEEVMFIDRHSKRSRQECHGDSAATSIWYNNDIINQIQQM